MSPQIQHYPVAVARCGDCGRVDFCTTLRRAEDPSGRFVCSSCLMEQPSRRPNADLVPRVSS